MILYYYPEQFIWILSWGNVAFEPFELFYVFRV
jgi:hypothetical protein